MAGGRVGLASHCSLLSNNFERAEAVICYCVRNQGHGSTVPSSFTCDFKVERPYRAPNGLFLARWCHTWQTHNHTRPAASRRA